MLHSLSTSFGRRVPSSSNCGRSCCWCLASPFAPAPDGACYMRLPSSYVPDLPHHTWMDPSLGSSSKSQQSSLHYGAILASMRWTHSNMDSSRTTNSNMAARHLKLDDEAYLSCPILSPDPSSFGQPDFWDSSPVSHSSSSSAVTLTVSLKSLFLVRDRLQA